jgi:hypothetical protein
MVPPFFISGQSGHWEKTKGPPTGPEIQSAVVDRASIIPVLDKLLQRHPRV